MATGPSHDRKNGAALPTHGRLVDGPEDLGGEVAEAVGYGAEASFSKVFKRFLGVAPGSYRRQAMAVQTR